MKVTNLYAGKRQEGCNLLICEHDSPERVDSSWTDVLVRSLVHDLL